MRTKIPAEVERRVVTRLYADAQSLDWVNLTSQERTAQYARWVADPEVGGKLKAHVSEGELRVWIKDGPMKELSRASSGMGRYAALIPSADEVPARLVERVLGEEWELVPGSVTVKPLRLTAGHRVDDREEVLTWGQVSDFKHLVWSALNATVNGDARPWTLCLVETLTHPTPANERRAHERLARRCGLTVTHVSLEDTP